MKVQWKRLLLTATCWLATEAYFNLVGIDCLADYSEFVLNQKISFLATKRLS